jgi:hypothetical protein
MSDRTTPADALIARLAGELRPIRRLPAPWRRATLWLGASAWLTGMLALFTDFTAIGATLAAAPDMWLATLGAILTAILAAFAAHLTSIPGRSPRWAVLPVPALLLWLGASAAGCLRTHGIAAARLESPMHPMLCFYFIVLAAGPLAVLLIGQVRRACPLTPRRTATLIGLASAAAAVSLLTLIHPFDAGARDLAAHFLAVGLIVLVVRQREA